MKYGTIRHDNEVFCKECGAVIAKVGEHINAFCKKCGAPLTSTAIEIHESRLRSNKNMFKEHALSLSKELNTLDITKVMEEF